MDGKDELATKCGQIDFQIWKMFVQIRASKAEVQESGRGGDSMRMNGEQVLLVRVKIGGLFGLQRKIVDHSLPEVQSSQPIDSSATNTGQKRNQL